MRDQNASLTCSFGEPWLGPHPLCSQEADRLSTLFAADVAAGKYDASGFTPADRKAQARKAHGRLMAEPREPWNGETEYLLGAFAEEQVIALSQGIVPHEVKQFCLEVLDGSVACVAVEPRGVATRTVPAQELAQATPETGCVARGWKMHKLRRCS